MSNVPIPRDWATSFFSGYMMAGPKSMLEAMDQCTKTMKMSGVEAEFFIDQMVERRVCFFNKDTDMLTAVDTSTRLPWKAWLEEAEKPMTAEGLGRFIKNIIEQDHDYESCGQAVVASTTATFNSMMDKMNLSGMQASVVRAILLRKIKGKV